MKKKILTMVMVAVLTVGSMEINVVSANSYSNRINDSFQKITTSNVANSSWQKIKEKKESTGSKNYKEGEAIVIVKKTSDTSTVKKAEKYIEKNQDVQVDDTYKINSDIASKKAIKDSDVNSEEGFYVQSVHSDSMSTDDIINNLESKGQVVSVEPNYIIKADNISNDEYADYQWGLDNEGQNSGTIDKDVNPESQWSKTVTSTKENVIAIVDSGVDYTHEDLKDVMWVNPYSESGKLAGTYGYDFCNSDDDPMDDAGHGTHCAGIIAGTSNNNVGISGVANTNVKIMALKFLDESGQGDTLGAIKAYYYLLKAKSMGVNVVAVNNSWGGNYGTKALEEVMKIADSEGIISVMAAGNSASNNDKIYADPADIKLDNSVVVAAATEKDERASFSNYGVENVDIAAPGTDILSSVCYYCFNPTIYSNKSELVGSYYDGENSTGKLEKIKVEKNKGIDVTSSVLTSTSEEFFGKEGKSAAIKIQNAKKGEIYKVSIPYSLDESSTDIYESIKIKNGNLDGYNNSYSNTISISHNTYSKNNRGNKYILDTFDYGKYTIGQGNYWRSISDDVIEANDTKKNIDSAEMTITINVEADDNICIYFDDFGVSKENVAEDKFGKYDFYNGTSMAAPSVTGAIGLLANNYSTAKEILSHLYSSVRKSSEWEYLCKTGGVLDLSKVDSKNPVIKSTAIDTSNNIKFTGYNFGTTKGTIKINNTSIASANIISWNDNNIVIKAPQFLYNNARIEITNSSGSTSSTGKCLKNSSKKLTKIADVDAQSNNAHLVSDGTTLYALDNGIINTVDEKSGDLDPVYSIDKMDIKKILTADEYNNGSLYVDYNISYGNGKLWYVTKIDMEYYQKYILNSFDIDSMDTTCIVIPDSAMDGVVGSVQFHNNSVYLVGGLKGGIYNEEADYSKNTVCYNLKTKKWEKKADLPIESYGGSMISYDNKLYYAAGLTNEDTVSGLYCFDGTKWTDLKVNFSYIDYMYQTTGVLYKNTMGINKGNLVFVSDGTEGCGSIMQYNIATKKLIPTGYDTGLSCGIQLGSCATLGNKLYFIINDSTNVVEDLFSNSGQEDDDEYTEEMPGTKSLYSMPVTAYIEQPTVNIPTNANTTTKVTVGKVKKFTSVKAGKKKLTLKWKKVSGVKGYRIQVSLKKTFKTKKSMYIKKNVGKATFKKLKSKKKYYIRVQAYKVKGKTKYFGKWTTYKKKVKVK